MYVEFYGAADCVTGSCHILKVNNKNILLDCGLLQGKDADDSNDDNVNFPFDPKDIDYVLLSHAHIDHSGRIPLLYKQGFKGQVICNSATKDLCNVMLPDSGHIQEMEVDWKNRKRQRKGMATIEPLYTAKIAELSLYLFTPYEYDEIVELFPGFKVRFRNAGHLLGGAIIEMFIREEGKEEIKVVYTGDLGNKNIPIIKDPTQIDYADYVIMESTYGNRVHEDAGGEVKQLADIIRDTFRRGGNVVIPSFAVGRTQEILYALNRYIDCKELKNIKVFVDSPLASRATKIFEDYSHHYDDEASKIINSGENPLEFEGLIFTDKAEDSIKINKEERNCIIISASGMCEAGRIRHHLKHNLWRAESSVIFVGYQAEGTLGRNLLNGIKEVKLFGEEIAVNCHIYNLNGLSGHADRNGLLNWVKAMERKPKEIIVVHGDDESRQGFKELLLEEGYAAKTVRKGQRYYINDREEKNKITLRERLETVIYSKNLDMLSKEELLSQISNIYDEIISNKGR